MVYNYVFTPISFWKYKHLVVAIIKLFSWQIKKNKKQKKTLNSEEQDKEKKNIVHIFSKILLSSSFFKLNYGH